MYSQNMVQTASYTHIAGNLTERKRSKRGGFERGTQTE